MSQDNVYKACFVCVDRGHPRDGDRTADLRRRARTAAGVTDAAADRFAALKRQAGEKAASLVSSGMVVGLGTGSTAVFATRRIGELIASGTLKGVSGVADLSRHRRGGSPLRDSALVRRDPPRDRRDDRRRRRGQSRARPDQGRRGSALPRKGRGAGEPARRHRRGRVEALAGARHPARAPGRGGAVRLPLAGAVSRGDRRKAVAPARPRRAAVRDRPGQLDLRLLLRRDRGP